MDGSLIFSGVSFYVTPGERKRELVAKIRENGGEVLSKYHPDAVNLLAMKTVSSSLLTNKQSESSRVYVPQLVDDCIEEKRCLPKEDYTLHAFLARANRRGDDAGTTLKKRQKYTKAEKLQVLMYGEDAKSKGRCVAGNELWKTAEIMGVTSHSWQSMRTQYQELSRLSQAEQRRLYNEVMQSLRGGDYESSTGPSSKGRETNSVESRVPLSSVAAFDSRVVSNKLDSELMEGGGLVGDSQNEESDSSQRIEEERTANRPKSLSAGQLEDLSKSMGHVEPHSPSSVEGSGNAVGNDRNAVEVRNRSPLALTKEEMEDSQLIDCFSTQAMTQVALAGSQKTIDGGFEWRVPEKVSNDIAKAVREESQESGEEEEEDDDSEQFDEARLLNMKEKFETDQARDRQLREQSEERRLVKARERETMKNTQAEKMADLESLANDGQHQESDGKKVNTITGVSAKPGEEGEESCGASTSSQSERPVKAGKNGGDSSVTPATGQQQKSTAGSKGARTLRDSHVDEQEENIRNNKQNDAASSGEMGATKGKQCGSEKEAALETKQGLEIAGIEKEVDGELQSKESAVIAGRCDAGDSLKNNSRSDNRDGKTCDIQHFKSSGSGYGDIAATGKEEDARELHAAERCPRGDAVDAEQEEDLRSSVLSDTVDDEARSSSDTTEGRGRADNQLSRNKTDLDTSGVALDGIESENETDADESTSRSLDDTDEDDEALTDTDVAQTQIVDKAEGFGRTGTKGVHCSQTELGEIQEQGGKHAENTKIEHDEVESRNRGGKGTHDVTASALRGVNDKDDEYEGIADSSGKTQQSLEQTGRPGSIMSNSNAKVADKRIRADESWTKFDEGSTTESEDDLPLTQLKFVRQKQMMHNREVDSVSDTDSGTSDRRRDTEGVGGSQPRDDEVEVDTLKLRNSLTEGGISVLAVEMEAECKEKEDEVEGDLEQTQVLNYGEESESDGHGKEDAQSRITRQVGPLTRQQQKWSDSQTEVDEAEGAGTVTADHSNEETEPQKESTLEENQNRVKRKEKSRLRREMELLKEDFAGNVVEKDKATTREDREHGGDEPNRGVTQEDETEGGEPNESMRSQGRLTKQQSNRRRTRRSGQDSPATRSKRPTLETERVSNSENDRRETDDSVGRSARSHPRTRSQDEDLQPRTALAQDDPSKEVTAEKKRPPHPEIREETGTYNLRNQSAKSAFETGDSGKSFGEKATRARTGSGDGKVLESEGGESERRGNMSRGRTFATGGARHPDGKRKGRQTRSRKCMETDDGQHESSSDEIEDQKGLVDASVHCLEISTQEKSSAGAAKFTDKRKRNAKRARGESAQDRKGFEHADVVAGSVEDIHDSQCTSNNGSGPGRKGHKRQAIGQKYTQGARIGTNASEEDKSLGVIEEDARGTARGAEKGQSSLRSQGVRGLINRVSRYSNQSEAAATHMLYLCNGDEDLAVRMLSGGFNPKMLGRDRARALWTKAEDVILKRALKTKHVSGNWEQRRTHVMADQRVQKIVSKRGKKAVIDRCRFLLG